MRSILTAFIVTTALPAWAEHFPLETDVNTALITTRGALITYTAPVDLPKGKHILTAHLPNTGLSNALADIRFAQDADVRILSRSLAVAKASPVLRKKSPALRAALEKLHQAEAALRAFDENLEQTRAKLHAAELTMTFLNTRASSNPGGAQSHLTADELSALVQTMASSLQAAHQDRAGIRTELRKLELGRDDLVEDVGFQKTVVDRLTPLKQVDLLEVTLEVQVNEATNTIISLDNIEPVSWSPLYHIDLHTDESAGNLAVQRLAQIHFNDAHVKPVDEWDDVHIILSTESLRSQTGTNIPQPELLGLAFPGKEGGYGSFSKSGDVRSEESMAAPQLMELAQSSSQATFSGEILTFDLGTGHSIGWQADQLIKSIDSVTRPVDLYAMANATQDKHAYLFTDFTNDTDGIWLSGVAKLHRDGSLIGETYFPQLLPNQSEPIGLGPLYAVRVKRDTLNVQEGDSGFLTSQSEVEREYITTLTSSLGYTIPVKLLDVAPTSEDEDLVVTQRANPKPTTNNRDGKRGVLVWEFDLEAGETQVIEFGYQMEWPSGQFPVHQ